MVEMKERRNICGDWKYK